MEFASPVRYAGFWVRLKAYGIDGTLVQLALLAILPLLSSVAHAQDAVDPNLQVLMNMGWIAPGSDLQSISSLLRSNGASGSGGWFDLGDLLVWLMASSIYHIWFTAGKWRATPGKRWCKLQVVMANGQPLTLLQSALRHAASGMSWLPFGLGYAMIGLAHQKTAMHDAMIGTRVIHRPLPDVAPVAITHP